MTDFSTVAAFGGAALVIPMVLALIKSLWAMPARMVPIACLALSVAWGALLWGTGYLDTDVPAFVVAALITAAAASGVREYRDTYSGDS